MQVECAGAQARGDSEWLLAKTLCDGTCRVPAAFCAMHRARVSTEAHNTYIERDPERVQVNGMLCKCRLDICLRITQHQHLGSNNGSLNEYRIPCTWIECQVAICGLVLLIARVKGGDQEAEYA